MTGRTGSLLYMAPEVWFVVCPFYSLSLSLSLLFSV